MLCALRGMGIARAGINSKIDGYYHNWLQTLLGENTFCVHVCDDLYTIMFPTNVKFEKNEKVTVLRPHALEDFLSEALET